LRPSKGTASAQNSEKFIFYRGKGQRTPPYRVRATDDGRLVLSHAGNGGAIAAAFALTVDGENAHWSKMPPLPAAGIDAPANLLTESITQPNRAFMPLDQVERELGDAIRGALEDAGLSRAEAHAMVATWSGNWFREPGTRVLAILPREWVDSVLPLTITPQPTKLERVFVGRFETMAPARESEVLALFDQKKNTGMRLAEYKALQLGRFANGALARAQFLQARRMADQFQMLRFSMANPGFNPQSNGPR
jgi:hypothetical protein